MSGQNEIEGVLHVYISHATKEWLDEGRFSKFTVEHCRNIPAH